MNRTVSSERPFGALSDSISVTKPYLYWSTSMRRTVSTVSRTAGIPKLHPQRFQGPRVEPCEAAQAARFSPGATCFNTRRHAVDNESKSDFADSHPKLRRIAVLARFAGTPIAESTW